MDGICKIENTVDGKYVQFLDDFNEELTPKIIQFLSKYKKVKFGRDFNKPVTYQTESSQNGKSPTLLPSGLTHLRFGDKFDQPVDNLPESLTHLEFGPDFNKPVTYQKESFQNGKSPTLLPNSLSYIEFRKEFTKNLIYIKFGSGFISSTFHK